MKMEADVGLVWGDRRIVDGRVIVCIIVVT